VAVLISAGTRTDVSTDKKSLRVGEL
jgi:hypothetical protein